MNLNSARAPIVASSVEELKEKQPVPTGTLAVTADGNTYVWNEDWLDITSSTAIAAAASSAQCKVTAFDSIATSRYHQDPSTASGLREESLRRGIEDILSDLRGKLNQLPLDDHWKTSNQIYSGVIKSLTNLLYDNN